MPNLKIGYLPQEPVMAPDQTVREAVEEGIGGALAAKKRLDEVYAEYGAENADFEDVEAADFDGTEKQREPSIMGVIGEVFGAEELPRRNKSSNLHPRWRALLSLGLARDPELVERASAPISCSRSREHQHARVAASVSRSTGSGP